MSKADDIRAVLEKLDPADDTVWTADGLPKLDLFPVGTKREDVSKAAPQFTRDSSVVATDAVTADKAVDDKKAAQESLLGQKEAIREKLDGVRAQMAKLASEQHVLLTELDEVEKKIEANAPPQSNSILEYLAAQQKTIDDAVAAASKG